MNQAFLRALAPWLERIEAYWTTANGGSKERFELWKQVMGTLTDSERNGERNDKMREYAAAGKKILIVIPERAHPRMYLEGLLSFARSVAECSGNMKNVNVIFTGGVTGIVGTDNKEYSLAELYGEFSASAMDTWLRDNSTKYDVTFPRENVTCDNLSKNTGDQAWNVSTAIMTSGAELVIFLGPEEHVARFALTIHKGLRTIEPGFRPLYQKRIAAMKMLVVPVSREGGWEAETDHESMTAAQDAFGPLEEKDPLLPNKQRGWELVERIGEEMYGAAAKTFIMNVTTLEDAYTDPLFSLEFENLKDKEAPRYEQPIW